MYIKYHDFKCECGEIVSPPFNELHFDMREGEILENTDFCGVRKIV